MLASLRRSAGLMRSHGQPDREWLRSADCDRTPAWALFGVGFGLRAVGGTELCGPPTSSGRARQRFIRCETKELERTTPANRLEGARQNTSTKGRQHSNGRATRTRNKLPDGSH